MLLRQRSPRFLSQPKRPSLAMAAVLPRPLKSGPLFSFIRADTWLQKLGSSQVSACQILFPCHLSLSHTHTHPPSCPLHGHCSLSLLPARPLAFHSAASARSSKPRVTPVKTRSYSLANQPGSISTFPLSHMAPKEEFGSTLFCRAAKKLSLS